MNTSTLILAQAFSRRLSDLIASIRRPCLSLLLVAACAPSALAGSREQALQIHNRVAGIPPSEAVLQQMTAKIEAQHPNEAVNIALSTETFYSVVLKNLVTPWTNREQTVFAPLNDYTATVIGLVRDNADFREVLSGDVLYISNASGLPTYNTANNAHYETLENKGISLKDTLERKDQSAFNKLPPEATAGVMTSRAAAKAFFKAGTNRAMFRFTLMNHLCRDLEQVHDTTRTPDFIRQDVSRSPGGDSRVFLNGCIGCHSGMDPLAKAFAYYDYPFNADADPDALAGYISYTAGVVQPKYLQNSTTFAFGYVTENDDWKNYWRAGINAHLGWNWGEESPLPEGTGAKSMGKELANSHAFASCQVEKIFKQVCFRAPENTADRNKIEAFTNNFKAAHFNLKQVFIDTATYCTGE